MANLEFSKARLREVYWKSCSHEGYLNIYIYRRISLVLAVIAAQLKATPNQVTLVSFVLSLVAAGMFGFGDVTLALWGLLPFHLGKILDCSDGQLASLTNQKSALGAFLDPFLDRVTDVAVLAALAVGYTIQTNSLLALYLLIALLSVWFIGAYLSAQSPDAGDAKDNLRQTTSQLPGFVRRLLKWDGGFTGLITTLAIVFNQVPLLLLLTLVVGALPLPLQLLRIYRRVSAPQTGSA